MERRGLGIGLAGITALISGVAVFVNGYGVRAWREVTDTTTYTTAKNLVAALVLIALTIVVSRRSSKEGWRLPTSRGGWLTLGAIAVIGGSVPFALFFEGLARSSSTDAAFLHKTLVIWVALLAAVFLRERLNAWHVGAIAALIVGQIVLAGGIESIVAGTGEAMILGATLLWSVEVVVAKKLLPHVSPLTLGVARMAGGSIVLIAIVAIRGGFATLADLSVSHLGWVLLTGVVLAGYVGSWYSALARAQAVDVTAVLVGGALITGSLRAIVDGAAWPAPVGSALVLAGVGAVMWHAARRARTQTAIPTPV